MVHDFQASSAVQWVRMYDHTRLIDTDSGGPANAEKIGDVNDLHAGEPNPSRPVPSETQYAMDGEYGNFEYFIDGHTWTNSSNRNEVCRLYRPSGSPPGGDRDGAHSTAAAYIQTMKALQEYGKVSAAGYVQLTDVEMECDGLLSYDRTSKFNASDLQAIRDANVALVGQPVQCSPLASSDRVPAAFPRWLYASAHAPGEGFSVSTVFV